MQSTESRDPPTVFRDAKLGGMANVHCGVVKVTTLRCINNATLYYRSALPLPCPDAGVGAIGECAADVLRATLMRARLACAAGDGLDSTLGAPQPAGN